MNVASRFRRDVGILAVVCAAAITTNAFAQTTRPSEDVRPSGTTRLNDNQEKELALFYASKLFVANQYELEISKLAASRATNPEIRRFGEALHRDHVSMIESLRSMVPASLATTAQTKTVVKRSLKNETDELDDEDLLAENDIDSDLTNRKGAANRTQTSGKTVSHRVSAEIRDPMLRRVDAMERLAARTRFESENTVLSRTRGVAFDVAFINRQISSCNNLLADLKAIEEVGPSELKALVSKTRRTWTSQLNTARELAASLHSEMDVDEDVDEDVEDDDDGEDWEDDDGGGIRSR